MGELALDQERLRRPGRLAARQDERAFLTYYAWQVFARTPTGVRRLTGPGRGQALSADGGTGR